MENDELVPVADLCTYYRIDGAFVHSLTEYGLIEMTVIEQTPFLRKEQLRDLERMIRLHYELDINLEGIDAISHLLQRLDRLQEEVIVLRNRLKQYE